jgi:hypothetical protein
MITIICNIPNYTFLSKPRYEICFRRSGGIGLFIHNTLYLIKFKLLILTVSDWDIFPGLDMRIVLKAVISYWVFCISHQSNLDLSLMMKCFELENDISAKRSQYDYDMISGDANAHTSNLPYFVKFDDFLVRFS